MRSTAIRILRCIALLLTTPDSLARAACWHTYHSYMCSPCRRQFSRCADELRGQGLEEEADVFSLGKSVVQLHDLCDYR